MADTPRPTDAELLAELAPLAVILAEKLRTVPVRLIGRGGADDLISELTLAAALYCAKHVLPTGPAPADRAAVLREAADEAENFLVAVGYEGLADELGAQFRRMADEAQQP